MAGLRAEIRPDAALVGQVGVPVDEPGAVIGDEDLPLVAGQRAASLEQGAVRAEAVFVAGVPRRAGGARVVAVVAGLSWSAVRAGDGDGEPGDVGVVEAVQDAGEADGDVVVAEAGGDAQDGRFGGVQLSWWLSWAVMARSQST